MKSIKEMIWGFFSFFDRKQDSNNVLQKYVECLAGDLEDNEMQKIHKALDNAIVPLSIEEKMLPFLELLVGLTRVTEDINIRKRFLSYIFYIYQIKGSILSYEVVLRLAGFTDVIITDIENETGFDSAITLDDAVRRFDSGGNTCKEYNIKVTGIFESTAGNALLHKCIDLVEPLNAKRKKIVYNDSDLTFFAVSLTETGELIFTPSLSGEILSINSRGELLIENELYHYFIQDGNLYVEDGS